MKMRMMMMMRMMRTMIMNSKWEVYACSYVNDCCRQLRLFVKGN
jgi:hypothetical protein